MKILFSILLVLSLSAQANEPENEIFIDWLDILLDLDMDEVIRGDDRDLVTDHRDPVSQAVGLLSYTGGFCTATLISPRHIITNGHCVAGGGKFKPPGDLKFYPGKLNAADKTLGEYSGIRIDTFEAWVKNGNADYDLAVVKLDKPVKGVSPMILQEQKRPQSLSSVPLVINGYSSKKPYGTQWTGTGRFVQSKDRNSFLHTIDTLPGTSGAVVRRRWGNGWIGVGVHRGSQNNPLEGGLTNRGVIFSPTMFNMIVKWMKN